MTENSEKASPCNREYSINVRSVNKFGKEAGEALTVYSSYQEEEGEKRDGVSGENEINRVRGVELEVRIDPGPVTLSVEADGNLVFSGTMLSGTAQIFRADEKISINSAKDSATFVKFNGKELGALGQSGGPVKGVIFTPDMAN
jgi:hypothetical protein